MSASTAAGAPGACAIDRESFKQVLKVPALRVPKQRCNDYMKRLRGCAAAGQLAPPRRCRGRADVMAPPPAHPRARSPDRPAEPPRAAGAAGTRSTSRGCAASSWTSRTTPTASCFCTRRPCSRVRPGLHAADRCRPHSSASLGRAGVLGRDLSRRRRPPACAEHRQAVAAILEQPELEFLQRDVMLDYSHFNADSILRVRRGPGARCLQSLQPAASPAAR